MATASETLVSPRQQLTSEYDVDADECLREVLDLVEELRAEGLVNVSEA